MPLRRFQLISRYFRTFDYTKVDVRDESDLPKTFQAAEEWSDLIQKVSTELYLPGTNLTVDECMVPFTGRSKETTLVKGKPTPVGFKVWVIAQQGFFLQWLWHVKSSLYTAVIINLPMPKPVGKKGKLQTKIPLSNTQSVVVHLVKRLLPQTYHVFTDNLFSSPQLFRLLRQLGFGATGTARPNCGISTVMKRIKETGKAPDGTPLKYNEVILIPMPDKQVIQIAWKDSGVVLFISTVHTGAPHERTLKKRKLPAKRGIKAEAQELQRLFNGDSFKMIPIPTVAAQYNDEMNHVDRGDQIRSYTTYEHRFRPGPWQALLWSFLLEVALANSFILQKKTQHPRWKPYSTLQAWKECICNAIFNTYAAEGGTRKRNRSGKEEEIEDTEARQKHLQRDINHVRRGSPSPCLACQGFRQAIPGDQAPQRTAESPAMPTLLERIVPLKPEIRLAQAIKQFEMDLSDEQKAAFDSNKRQSCHSPPNIHDVMRLTAEIDRRVAGNVGGGRCFGTRLVNVLEAVQRFAALGDIVVGGSQNMIACGVWSLVRMTLLMLVNVSSWFDKLSELFMTVGRSAPRYQAMALLYPRSKKLQSHLAEYFLVVVRICHDLLKLTRKSMFAQLVSFITESDMSSYQSDFDLWANAIKEEVNLLMAQQLQEQSRRLESIDKYSKSESHRKKLENRLRILDSCSTYDYQTTWKEIRRCGNTNWFTLQREYQDWKVRSESRTLLYAGKLGSGKSISLANMVDDLNLNRKDNFPVAYFFCRHDVPESLQARTILGSLARQLLCTIGELITMSEDLAVTVLPALDSDGILRLLNRTVNPTCRAYFILDGLDECDENQREDMIRRLQQVQGVIPLLVCLSFRQEAGNALTLRPEHFAKPSVIFIPENNPDIAEFIQTELERRLESRVESRRLRVGVPTLVLEIRDALLERAQGMFLWVVLQINSLCLAKTDESIRHALADLPRDLPGTFSRILEQSAALGKEDQRRILELITAAYRPLTTDELREAGDSAAVPIKVVSSVLDSSSIQKVALRLLKSQKPSSIDVSKVLAREAQCSKMQPTNQYSFLFYARLYWAQHTLRDSKQDPAIYRSLCRALDRNVLTVDASDEFGRTPLWWAVERGQEAVVRLLLEKGAAIEAEGDFGRIALSWAAKGGHEAVVRLLLEKGAASELKGGNGRTTLSWAAERGQEAVVRLLLEKGAAIEAEDGNGRTPLSWAAGGGHEAVVRLLLDNGAAIESKDDLGRTPLSWTAVAGHEAVVRLLLDNGAAIESKDNGGRTPLPWAAGNGHEAVVRLLLEKGANTDLRDTNDRTPLWWAARNGHEAVVRLLLEKSAAIESKDDLGRTPLSWTAGNGHEAVVRLLLDKGAAIESKDNTNGWTPLRWAAGNGHEAVVRLLLDKGAAIESKDFSGGTPLWWATERGHEAMMRLLLDKGAAIESKDSLGRTPLSWAAGGGHEAVVRLLLEKGAAIESKDDLGRTPLSWAAGGGHGAVVRLLLDKGAAIESKDYLGRTPLPWAAQSGHEAVVRLLDSSDHSLVTMAEP
ncbi:hypothetical protein BFJ68_g17134 [Fusarium oxysporum]|uniref:Uncharacterized protein n=1 Tax=Fusarium oxysporum TaxID=5507 RepID=A0A420P1W0_FUSOX|nr:hypothetical protein BFJ68_g17134 [Fusarium oxysporum]